MNERKRKFFSALYQERDELPDNWNVKSDTVTDEVVEVNPVQFHAEDSFQYKVLILFQDKVIVRQAMLQLEVENREEQFDDPEIAGIYTRGLLDSTGFIQSDMFEQEEDNESDEDSPLDELFGGSEGSKDREESGKDDSNQDDTGENTGKDGDLSLDDLFDN